MVMKRDMDLIRSLLMAVEKNEHGFAPDIIEIPNHTQEEIGYHAFLLGEAGLAVVKPISTFGSESPSAIIRNLTWAGHEFLDSARNNTIWNQAKDKAMKIGAFTLPIISAILTDLIKKQLGLS